MKTLLARKPRAASQKTPSLNFHVPASTYRLQLNSEFPLSEAIKILPYLKALGISDCYLSPVFRSRHGSPHGYDTVSHQEVNPELGGEQAFFQFAAEAEKQGLSLLLDVVPNHMCISDAANHYWMDVLENGPASPYARFFDINWTSSKKELLNKVLLPFLGDQYGKILESGEIRLLFESNSFWIAYYDWRLPVSPRSWGDILSGISKTISNRYKSNHPDRMELESILNGLNYLPTEDETSPERKAERQREKEILKKRLGTLVEANPLVADALQAELQAINGQRGNPRSFDRLEELLSKQAYRLCDWKVAADEINYRRFFDINDLAAIRVEDPEVFRDVHQTVLQWKQKGLIQGLRIDHVDGLLDPQRYLDLVKEEFKSANGQPSPYVVVEKILSKGERLNPSWPVQGSTGYDFMNWVNGLFVEVGNADTIFRFYRKFAHPSASFNDVVVTSKKLIMLVSMASELRRLAFFIDDISEQHRWSRDFTLESLRFALREVVACFPVYRTYIREGASPISESDRSVIAAAVLEAKQRNPATPESIFDFIHDVLTLHHPDGLTDEQKRDRVQFVMKFQQFTSPVMAKGLEDTAFYRYGPLISLNEVGGRPDQFGVIRRSFHRAMVERQKNGRHSLSASSTHDTKRTEDVRARINVLSEIPIRWRNAVRTWHKLNLPHKFVSDQQQIPDKNEEYLIYQTLVGSWPLNEKDKPDYAERIKHYCLKAIREAKVNSSWVKPNLTYEKAALEFVGRILDPQLSSAFLREFELFQAAILRAGLFNALSQTLLKMACPGVPDFYQGTEKWNFSLVDPDNRRPVDFAKLAEDFSNLASEARRKSPGEFLMELLNTLPDGRAKLFLTQRALAARNRALPLFRDGAYLPLLVEGKRRRNVIAFLRTQGPDAALVLTGHFFMDFENKTNAAPGPLDWDDTVVLLPLRMRTWIWRDILSGRVWDGKSPSLLRDLLPDFPCALFERVKEST